MTFDQLSKIMLRHLIAFFAIAIPLAFIACGNSGNVLSQSNANPAPNVSPDKSHETRRGDQQPDAEEPVNLIIVVDSSGSMAARSGVKSKMDVAKEVLGALVDQIPSTIETGLRVYGHRSKNDCRDTELLVPIGPIRKEEFRQRVQSMIPLGQTPISYALTQAAEDLKAKAGKKVIILVSDGEETCGANPCAVAAELKKLDVDLRLHVVGFDIGGQETKRQLDCIAKATGGLYFDAKDAGQLLAGLEEAVRASARGGRLVSVCLDSTGREVDWHIDVFTPGANQPVNRINSSLGPADLSPGAYDLHYWGGDRPDVWKRGVLIAAGQETRVEVNGFGRLSVSVRDQKGNEVPMYKDVFRSGEDQKYHLIYEDKRVQELPGGRYDLHFWKPGRKDIWRREVEIKPGQETRIEVETNE